MIESKSRLIAYLNALGISIDKDNFESRINAQKMAYILQTLLDTKNFRIRRFPESFLPRNRSHKKNPQACAAPSAQDCSMSWILPLWLFQMRQSLGLFSLLKAFH